MSSQDRPETTAAASAPARQREPEPRPAEPRGESMTTGSGSGAAGTQGGRRHARRRPHRTGGGEREPQPRGEGRQPERELNLDELRDLSELLNEQGFNEFEIEREGFRLRLSRQSAMPPAAAAQPVAAQPFVPPTVTPMTEPPPAVGAGAPTGVTAPAGAEAQPVAAAAEPVLHKITSPIVGTFYHAPSPTAAPFVQVGSRVGPDTVVCIIEAMKLMNEIQADASGMVEEIYVENGQPVEFGQALFGIRK